MHTICVPAVHDMHHTPPYIAQTMGAFSTLTTHRMHLLLTGEQNDWLESQATGLRNKSAVVRDLIDTARQGLTGGSNVGAYSVGAGDQSVRVPAVQAVPEPPTASETAVQAVEDSAETKKKSEDIEKAKKRFIFSVPEDLTNNLPLFLISLFAYLIAFLHLGELIICLFFTLILTSF